MKLTKREKILVAILIVVVFIGLIYKFVVSPQLKEMSNLKKSVYEYKSRVDKVKMEVSQSSPLKKEYKIMNVKTKVISQNLFPSITQEKIIYIINDLLVKANLNGASIAFSDVNIKSVELKKELEKNNDYLLKELKDKYKNNYIKKAQSKEVIADEKDSSDKTEKMTITINFQGKYIDLINFIKLIENYDKKIILSDLKIINDSLNNENINNNTISGSIVLDFYAIPKLYDNDEDYLKLEYNGGYGKDDPFAALSGYNNSTTNNIVSVNTVNDFEMIVHPLSSDLPTIQIGRSKDKTGKTNIYADNPDFDNVELQITQVDKKYYYKYKTSQESYPQNYEGDMMEFTPNGLNVNLYISSAKRNSSEDNSGVNLTLFNKSNLKLNIKVNYDDEKKPRVKIIKKTGNVFVEK